MGEEASFQTGTVPVQCSQTKICFQDPKKRPEKTGFARQDKQQGTFTY